ncbi:hypothetical protein [Actinoplanes utahensis]|uniref:hypothetical protein n=1 Tax=Actinoplanes utahensis TaxID=1869 RepID=UPI00068F0987|nr:hypothetical protein [Actinoplanes utahensis]GIF29426.1 hypothetical protein Aut01nite_24120 [Actinoplanes utahensis]
MRKLWCAGAIAGGVLLLTAAPAQADVEPAPGKAPGALSTALGYAFEPTNDWRLGTPLASDPLSGQPLGAGPVLQVEPGRDRALLQVGRRNDVVRNGTVVQEHTGTGKTKGGKATDRPLMPAADVIRTVPRSAQAPAGPLGGVPVHGVPMPLAGQDMRVVNVPVDGLVGRLSGLTPSGSSTGGFVPVAPAGAPGTRTPSPDERPIAPRLENRQSDYPLLGGLAGALPVIPRQVADVQSEFSGMPMGGEPVWAARSAEPTPDDGAIPAASAPASPAPDAPAPATDAPMTGEPATGAPATDAPATDGPTADGPAADSPVTDAPSTPATTSGSATLVPSTQPSAPGGFAAGVDDPRLHEEPVDGFVNRAKQ